MSFISDIYLNKEREVISFEEKRSIGLKRKNILELIVRFDESKLKDLMKMVSNRRKKASIPMIEKKVKSLSK